MERSDIERLTVAAEPALRHALRSALRRNSWTSETLLIWAFPESGR